MSLVDVIEREEFQTRGAKRPFKRLKKHVRIVWGASFLARRLSHGKTMQSEFRSMFAYGFLRNSTHV